MVRSAGALAVILLFAAEALAGEAPTAKPPTAEIRNGQLSATIYLPDPIRGFYHSTRFDWSGIIPSLTYRGHEFYGPWFYRIDPAVYDLGYD